MTKEQLLEKAKKDYPIGTKIKYLNLSGTSIEKEVEIEKSPNLYTIFDDFSIDAGAGKGYLYKLGKWAEIISRPTENMKKYTIEDLKTKKFGKDWVVKIDNEKQHEQLKKHFPRMHSYKEGKNAYLVALDNMGSGSYEHSYPISEYNKIKFNQIEFMEKKKIIIGYRLIKPEFREAALKICPNSIYLSSQILRTLTGKNYISEDCTTALAMERAGVLNIWFEPVYEEEPEIVSMGNGAFNLIIKRKEMFHGKEVFHGTENITEYVKSIAEFWEQNMKSGVLTFNGYDFLLNATEIPIYKTGCQQKETKLSEWLEIYNKIK